MALEIEQGESLVDNREGSNITYNHELKRVDLADRRLYNLKGTDIYYPSVTTILGSLPTDPMFLRWLQEVGQGAETIRNRAAREGSQVHEGIEKLLAGEQLDWVDNFGNARYSSPVWKMLLRFQDFYNEVHPETLASELFLYSKEHEYAGTTDALFKVGDETWLIDFKSSNHLHTLSYDAQLAAYAVALEERKGIKPDRCGILWLKSGTRKKNVNLDKGICQGEGWQVNFVDDVDQAFKVFKLAYEMYKITHPNELKPDTKEYPTTIKL